MPNWLSRILASIAFPAAVLCFRDHHAVWGGVCGGVLIGLIFNAIDRRRA